MTTPALNPQHPNFPRKEKTTATNILEQGGKRLGLFSGTLRIGLHCDRDCTSGTNPVPYKSSLSSARLFAVFFYSLASSASSDNTYDPS
eukprot:2821762-Amphidinium_carterae.1